MFGDFVKRCRLKADLSLREFCRLIGEDPSNWSKIEREILAPPQDEEKLSRIARFLQIQPDSEPWKHLIDYAVLDNGRIPPFIRSNKDIMNALPVFFRTLGNMKPTTENIREFIRSLEAKDS
jgi:transcriptional regulator with XRE-family HTH domain